MTDLFLYNSLTRQKERFIPLEAGKIKMYVCGMTVYDFCHIGHARVMVVFDAITRHLRNSGFSLNFVRNITDIDDKIIKRAQENQEDYHHLTARFIAEMKRDEEALFCLSPDFEPRATDYIPQMIDLIEQLMKKGLAYQTENHDVYYAVERFPEYGKLANRDLNEQQAGARVSTEGKQHAHDFVLWKSAKPDEPSWDSPWGKGRPGWHIECSAMSLSALGAHFDIHGGGMDLKFPHHECEIAQSEGACGHQTVNYWLHNGFVNIDNEKMSKSLGNFFTIREVLEKYNGEVIRFFILLSHYRSPLNYSDAGLEEAKKGLSRLYGALSEFYVNPETIHDEIDKSAFNEFLSAMNDDFNTPKAIAVLFDLARRINSGEKALLLTLRHLGNYLGLFQQDPQMFLKGKGELSAEIIEHLVQERLTAKANKDFKRADEIRQELKDLGITLKDTPQGCEWFYD